MNRGFTLIEIAVIVAILLILSTIVVSLFSQFNRDVMFSRNVERIFSMLEQARTNTISSKGGIQYGVHFEADKVVVFSGAVYSVDAPDNDVFLLSGPESLTNITLAGGGNNVLFSRIMGGTENFGSVTLLGPGDEPPQKVITIFANGLVHIE